MPFFDFASKSFLNLKNIGFRKLSHKDIDLWKYDNKEFVTKDYDSDLTNYYEGVSQEVILSIFSGFDYKSNEFFKSEHSLFDDFFSVFSFDQYHLSLFIEFILKNTVPQVNFDLEKEGNVKISNIILNSLDTSDPIIFIVDIKIIFEDGTEVNKIIKLKKPT
ncbi:MAG: hypothetical protein QW727_03800 [Candidatus Pacearchaeota archaeon]